MAKKKNPGKESQSVRKAPPSTRIWKHGAAAAGWTHSEMILLGDSTHGQGGGPLIRRRLMGFDGTHDQGGGPLIHLPSNWGAKSKSNTQKLPGADLFGAGYLPDEPDQQDFLVEELAAAVAQPKSHLAHHCRRSNGAKLPDILPGHRDLRKQFGPVATQGPVQSCTALAVLALVDFEHRKKTRRARPGAPLSALFLYKVAREMLSLEGDVGCTLRETLKAVHRYGGVLEEHWPYEPGWIENVPRVAHLEAARHRRQFAHYYRLDDYNANGAQTLENVLHALADDHPVAFGFSVYSSIDRMGGDHVIPFPQSAERRLAGHAVLAIGYELDRGSGGPGKRKGRLIIRNSWGISWGEKGYGYLPFEYVGAQLACDFWAAHCELA